MYWNLTWKKEWCNQAFFKPQTPQITFFSSICVYTHPKRLRSKNLIEQKEIWAFSQKVSRKIVFLNPPFSVYLNITNFSRLCNLHAYLVDKIFRFVKKSIFFRTFSFPTTWEYRTFRKNRILTNKAYLNDARVQKERTLKKAINQGYKITISGKWQVSVTRNLVHHTWFCPEFI